MTTANIFDIKRYGITDGNGIRTVIFIKGCPLRCQWCQNPEGLSKSIALWHIKNVCVKCGGCIASCPKHALSWGGGEIAIDHYKCGLCGECIQECPVGALRMDGATMSVDEVFEQILKDEVFYRVSGGGVTLSGGECTASSEFALELLAKCRENGIDTAIETCMYVATEVLKKFIECTNKFIVDIKIMDEERHIKATGVSNALILKNFKYLCEAGVDLMVRIPMIPGYTSDEENIRSIGKFVAEINPHIPIELINFNPLCTQKYDSLHREFIPERQRMPLSQDEMLRRAEILRESGIQYVK